MKSNNRNFKLKVLPLIDKLGTILKQYPLGGQILKVKIFHFQRHKNKYNVVFA